MAEHKRRHVQAFAYDEELHQLRDFKSSGAFLDFLHHSTNEPIPLPSTPEIHEWSLKTFFKAANTIAQAIKSEHFSTSDTLVFKSTRDKSLSGHVTDTEYMPYFIAVFSAYFEDETMLWPYIRLTGEHATKGRTRKDQEKQAISHLHYLLLARPDLYVAQGILTSKNGITFLVGIGGHGVRSLVVDWNNKELSKLMYAFIFCLYRPDKFADPSYEIGRVKDDQVTYTIKLPIKPGVDAVPTDQQVVICRDFLPIYASSPFGTRTHVFSKPDSEVTINNKRLMVLKDQFCRVGTRFYEHDILDRVHTRGEKVPGVVEAVYNDVIALPVVGELVYREKYRLGMGQCGDPFMTIPNVKAMLEAVFDILEVLRFLRMHRNVLHRDISKGNVVYVNRPQNGTAEVCDTRARECRELPVFARYFLGESDDPHETSALLIDFENAKVLENRTDGKRVGRTGTPVFMARAVDLGRAVTFSTWSRPPTPKSPVKYAETYPERLKKFEPEEEEDVDSRVFSRASKDSDTRVWRHELDHDVESVFWLMFYWALTAQPEKGPEEGPKEDIDPATWGDLMGGAKNRQKLIVDFATEPDQSGILHSAFEPLMELVSKLADVLRLDRHWLDSSHRLNDPEYIVEVFQRLILQFILDNRDKVFMGIEVDRQPRDVEEIPPVYLRSTTSQRANFENEKKRTRPKVDDNNSNERHPLENHVEEDEALQDVDDTVDDTEENWQR